MEVQVPFIDRHNLPECGSRRTAMVSRLAATWAQLAVPFGYIAAVGAAPKSEDVHEHCMKMSKGCVLEGQKQAQAAYEQRYRQGISMERGIRGCRFR